MDDKRKSKRMKAVLPLKIFGSTTAGQPFAELVYTLNISRAGTRIAGVQQELRGGDIIVIEYKSRRVRCEVVWVHRPKNDTRTFHLGLRCLDSSEGFWGITSVEEAMEVPLRVVGTSQHGGGQSVFTPSSVSARVGYPLRAQGLAVRNSRKTFAAVKPKCLPRGSTMVDAGT